MLQGIKGKISEKVTFGWEITLGYTELTRGYSSARTSTHD